MPYQFDEIIDRRGTHCEKWDLDAAHRPLAADGLPMWVADMDFAVAPPITRALHEAVDRRIYGYSDNDYPEFLENVFGFYRRRHGWEIKPGQMLHACGVVPALVGIVAALTNPGEGVIIQPPVYPPFPLVAKWNRREVVENPLIYENGEYKMDFEDLARKAKDPNNTMMILCSPHNPCGRVWTQDELREVYRICHENGVLLVSDEIHCDLLRKGVRHTPLLSLFPDARDIIACVAPTKTFNIAGLGCSFVFVPDPGMHKKVRSGIGMLIVNPLTTAAVSAAYSECDDWLDELLDYLDGNFAYFRSALCGRLPGAMMPEAQGTYLAWPDLSAYVKDTAALETALAEKGLAIEAGSRFGAQGEGFLRVNLACPRAYLTRAVDLIASALG